MTHSHIRKVLADATCRLSNDYMVSYLPSRLKSWVFCELTFLNVYMVCCDKWNESPFGGKDKYFGFFDGSDQIEEVLIHDVRTLNMSEQGCFELVENIHQYEPVIKKDCLNFLDSSFKCQFSVDELKQFLLYVSSSLRFLCIFEEDMTFDAKLKIESLQDNLDFFIEVFRITQRECSESQDWEDFKAHIEACTFRAACISLLWWAINEKAEAMTKRLGFLLSDVWKKMSPPAPVVIRMYLAVLKASQLSDEHAIKTGEVAMKFVQLLEVNFPINLEEDCVQMLFTDFIFLITFLMDQKKDKKFAEEKLILTEADELFYEVVYLISSFNSEEFKEGIAEEMNFLIHAFLEKANTLKVKVKELSAQSFPDSLFCNFPRVNVLGFIDSLLENLKDLCIHFPRHQIMILQKELLSLKESNLDCFSILEMQHQPKDVENLWTRIVNVAYKAERAVSSFIFLKHSLWHDILSLSDAIEELKLIKDENNRIQDQHKFCIDGINSEMSPKYLLPLHANVSIKKVVGFKNEEKEMRDLLIDGSDELRIISIVGMPGLGKTTLAKKVFGDNTVQSHFHKFAWCAVSQAVHYKRILLDILSDIVDCRHNNLSDLEQEDLAEIVYKSLKGQRYLIVMDDIWDASAWNVLKISFPDDKNGSRILFTTRIFDMLSETKCYHPFPLNPLSEEECLELLKNMLFEDAKCPLGFVEIGKKIARNCKGLPLSVVIVAGLLKEKVGSEEWWNQVGVSLEMLITEEGCRDVLELSYKHLPEFLKPCFLYFGLFEEDEEIRVKRLIRLWISEGFIQKQEFKSLEVVAEEYLKDLVSRSLVTVTKTSSRGGIKACGVHDLLREFCIAKGEDENFIKLIPRGNEDRSILATCAQYRVHIKHKSWKLFLEQSPIGSSVRSLLYPGGYAWNENVESLSFPYLKFLRVLDIQLIVDELPENMVLLRYLAIHYGASHISPPIKKLENLESLCVYDKYGRAHELPISLWEMQKLRHVSGAVILPAEFSDLGIAAPVLENVQAFSTVLYYEQADMFFRTIPKVQNLKCMFRFSPDLGVRLHQVLKLDFLSHLESLCLDHGNFDYLGLESCAFHFPQTLKKLTLMGFRLPWSEISPIGQLKHLEVLKLCAAFHGETWNVGDEEFLKLKCLVLKHLNIEVLDVSDSSFLYLERLVVEKCINFKEMPSRFTSIDTLKMIEVKDCKYSINKSVKQIQEEQAELGNEDLEVRIIGRSEPESSKPGRSEPTTDIVSSAINLKKGFLSSLFSSS